jgi:carbohydrate binding protein with CBM11 domain
MMTQNTTAHKRRSRLALAARGQKHPWPTAPVSGIRAGCDATSGARHLVMFMLLIAWVPIAIAAHPPPAQSPAPPVVAETQPLIIIQAYREGLTGVRTANPDVQLSIGRDPSIIEERILIVDYPARTDDPAGRDVQCAAVNQNWTAGRAISFQVKPDHATRMSFSFMDRNRVAYTAWVDLQAGAWQSIRIPFDALRPNPFFQPPDAKRGAPIDVSDVKAFAFAPQDDLPGRLMIGSFVVSR